MESISSRPKLWLVVITMLIFAVPIYSVISLTTISTNDIEGVALAPISDYKFAIAWCDETSNNMTLAIYSTNGTQIGNNIVLEDKLSSCYASFNLRTVEIRSFDDDYFVVAWTNPVTVGADDYMFAVYDTNGTEVTSPTYVGLVVSLNGHMFDIDVLDDTNFVFMGINKTDYKSYYKVFNKTGAEILSRQLLYDDSAIKHMSVVALDPTTFVIAHAQNYSVHNITGATLLDTTQMTIYSFSNSANDLLRINSTHFAYGFMDSHTFDPTYIICDISGNCGSRHSIANTNDNNNNLASVIMAGINDTAFIMGMTNYTVGSGNGQIFRVVDTEGGNISDVITVDAGTETWFDIIAKQTINNVSIKENHLVYAYVKTSTNAVFETYDFEGNIWDGLSPAPKLTTPLLTPDPAYTYSNLTVNTTYDHSLGYTTNLTVEWYVDGSNIINETFNEVGAGITINSTLGSGNYSQTNIINVTIIGTDNTEWLNVTAQSAELTISNHAPTFDESFASISTFHVVDFETQLNVTDVDGDTITWADNTTLFDINSTGYINDNPTQGDDGNYSIRINVTDGFDTANMDFTYEIINRVPTIDSAVIVPDPADILDNLTCINGSVSDGDGDSLTLEYNWYNNSVLTSITTQGVGSGNYSIGDQWYCMINVTDGAKYSGAVTSQTVIVDSLKTAPILNYTNATSATVQLTSDSTNPTQNNSWVNLSITFADPNAGEKHTAYFCRSNAFNGECDGDTFCVSAINTTSMPTLTCRHNLSSETSTTINYYAYVVDNETLHQGSGSGTAGTFVVNYPPTVPTITVPLNNSWVTTNSSTLQFSSTDFDGDTITYLVYGAENGVPTNLINATQSTFNWTNLNETYYNFKVRANDSHGYLTDINSTTIKFGVDYTAPTIENNSLSATLLYTDETMTISIDCSDSFSGANTTTVQFNITDALLALSTEDMTYISGNTYNDVYVPLGVAGTYDISTFWCYDLAGNYAEFTSNLTFSATIRPATGGGGGSSSSTIIQSVQLLNYSVCGNAVCEEGESPATCPVDCSINFDRMIKCLWDPDINCLYSDTWFVTIIFVILVGTGILLAYAGETKNVKRRRKV